MTKSTNDEATTAQVLWRAGVPVFVTWLLITLTFVLPLVDSTRPPYFDLTQTFSQLAYWMTQSGGKYGAPVVAIAMLALLVTRGGIAVERKRKEAGIVVLIAVVCAGGGAALNEHVIKAELKVPRPNIIWLAGENGSGSLGMTPENFYQSGNKKTRSVLLSRVLNNEPAAVPLSPAIQAHWVEETGYSFPSGHAFTAMFFAAFMLMLAVTYIATNRLWVYYALLPWALAVCYSRPILRVHTPTDIVVGGLQGLLIGFLAWAVARMLIRRFA